ncbi:Uncharacterized conserved protein YlxW, UPF0749 family [Anaerobranca californiensis DSM 14826]|jgi:hypothetical protein|uniref:Uncharacterized conserved protein YlxW, UPF0749 family n=1 Tax=Anaerobranca californiensis DSM 14826 TaxID=1120989 RepID=A0A1M6N642_9FIRM|nr:DUF881 domain-containing protein [Anaerobranca californiensis]SHJ91066.1 Uncharacterized conserved protein YlxW, UPF0749 family [Anaerobranca californiensis DSM 14826]
MYTRKIDLKLSIIAIMLILIFAINTFLLITSFVEKGQSLKTAKEYAQTIVDYYQKVAKDSGVYTNSAVQNVLSRFMYEINLANSNDELARVIVNLGNETQNVIRRETESRQANIILSMVSTDPNLSSIVDSIRISISFNTQGDIIFNDGGLLSQKTKDEISEYIHSIPILWERVIEMEIEHGTSRLVTPRSSEEKEQRLKSEIDMLKAEIESLRIATGYAEMTGEGLIIKLYDNPNVYGNISPYIIHDLDLLDLVNELFSSGARGIAIDGRRLTTTSSIRCVGPVIHVDHEPIRVEPIEIHVAGNPEILKSGLSLFFRTRFEPRGIIYDVQIVDQITLPAYSRRR